MRWPTVLVFVLGCYAAHATKLTDTDQDELCLKAGVDNLYYNYKAYYDCRKAMGKLFKTTTSKEKILQELSKKTEFVKHGIYTTTEALQLFLNWEADEANRFVAGVMSNKELDKYSKSDILRRVYEFGGSIALWRPFLHVPFQAIFNVFEMMDYLLEKPTHYSFYAANYYNWLLTFHFDRSKVGCSSNVVMGMFSFLSNYDRRKSYQWRTDEQFLFEIFQLICDNRSVWTEENLYWLLGSDPLLDVHKEMLKHILQHGGGILKLTRNSPTVPDNIHVDNLVKALSACQEFENSDIDQTCATDAGNSYRAQYP